MTTDNTQQVSVYINEIKDTTYEDVKVLDFKSLIGDRNTENNSFKFILGPGRYVINKWQVFYCSVFIYGEADGSTELYIGQEAFQSLFTEYESKDGTKSFMQHLFHFNYTAGSKQRKVCLQNLVFITDPNCKCGGSPYTRGPLEKCVVRIDKAYKVDIHNVRMKLNNGMLTNFEIESSNDISMFDCVLENYNYEVKGEDGKSVGGILWITKGAKTVNIQRNVMRKYGNDEILALYDINSGSVGNLPKNTWKDINIKLNTFEYGDSTHNTEVNELFIQLGSNSWEDKEDDNESTWDNVQFMLNKIILNAPVRRSLWVRMTNHTNVGQFLISDNLFFRSTLAQYLKSSVDETIDLYLERKPDNAMSAKTVQVYRNQFISQHTLYGHWFGHRCLNVDNLNVSFTGNLYDGSRVTRSANSIENYAFTSCLCMVCSGPTILNILENNVVGLDKLVYMQPTHKEYNEETEDYDDEPSDFKDVKLIIQRNVVSGTPLIDCVTTSLKVSSLSLDFRQNQVVNTTSPVLMKYFPSKASVKIVQNLFAKKRGLDNNGVLATNTPTISSLEMTNNTFCGYTKTTLEGSVQAVSKTVSGNNFASY